MQKYKKKSYCKFVLHLPYLHLISSLVPPYRRSWFVFSSSFVYLPVWLAPSFVRLLFVHCSSFVRLLFVHCSFIVRSLFAHCSFIVRSLFVHCSSFLRLFFVFSSSFLRLFIICLSCYDCPCGSHLPMRLAHLLICQLFPIFAPNKSLYHFL